MCALGIHSLFSEQTGFDVASDYGEDIFHSSQHHRKKQVLQLDQDCILSSQLVAECPNSSALFLVKRHIQRSSMLT